ncbi:hypothetical protein HZA97_08465 [Candidatus Woesearchaeota archaeon]|nr:hypothetical protein [Candidatus Woesearchaeota archaeon]
MTTKPRICLQLNDGFAGVYAFSTLYDFLISRGFDAEYAFFSNGSRSLCRSFNSVVREATKKEIDRRKIINSSIKMQEWPDLVLTNYCDVRGELSELRNREVAIDVSVLKNCVTPVSEEKRKELQEKYKLPQDKPTVVIGFPRAPGFDNYLMGRYGEFLDFGSLKDVIDAIQKDTNIYFVGSVSDVVKSFVSSSGLTNVVNVIEAFGVLRDYYAMSDVAMISSNIKFSNNHLVHLHNFVEATAGGPLFLVSPLNTKQYGYKQLKQLGVIRESLHTAELIDQVKKYLQTPQGEQIRELRRQHLESSKEVYLNDLLRLFNRILNRSEQPFQSDLVANLCPYHPWLLFGKDYHPRLRIAHPDTKWKLFEGNMPAINLSEIPEQVYDKFRREK